MDIVVRVMSLGTAGDNVSLSFECVAAGSIQAGGEATISPTWTETQIQAEIADAARDAVRDQGHSVAADAPVVLLGGVARV